LLENDKDRAPTSIQYEKEQKPEQEEQHHPEHVKRFLQPQFFFPPRHSQEATKKVQQSLTKSK
jgi:hypothetical protein